jgi:membrane protein implicated in regulation of membrane protease activity
MMNLLQGLGTINCVYMALLTVGFLYALMIVIGGGLSHIDLPDVGIDVPHIDLPGDVDIPDVHVDISSADVGSFDHGMVQVSPLSPITMAAFITSFGGVGIVTTQLFGVRPEISLLWATLGGFITGGVVYLFYGRLLVGMQASSEVRTQELVGAVGEVIAPISASGVGEVAYVAKGSRISSPARSATGQAIPRGTPVVIERVVGGTALVRPQPSPDE